MLTICYGTRPEAVKLACVVQELRLLGVPHRVVCTGQHTDLLRGMPFDFEAESLGVASDGDWMRLRGRVEMGLAASWRHDPPKAVVVQGDTASASAGAIQARAMGIPVAHVEAGVRSHDTRSPRPEEEIRCGISRLAQRHYAATETAFSNLIAEGVPQQDILLTGNPGVSTMHHFGASTRMPDAGHILVTLHRRELLDDPELGGVVERFLMEAIARGIYLLWPVHPALRQKVLPGVDWDRHPFYPPMYYSEFAHALASARGVITDSGGVTEEACTLGVPCVQLRWATDRPEALAVGNGWRCDPTAAGAEEAVLRASCMVAIPSNVYGTPNAAKQIACDLWEWCESL